MFHSASKGFSLIEVLVSILVLAVGVIGTAGMQLAALRTGSQSAFQSAAVRLAGELADRMRANSASMNAANSNNPYIGIDFQGASEQGAAPPKSCYTDACSSQELAQFEVHDWQRRLAAALPNARAVVCRDAQPWSTSEQAFTWDCDEGGGNPSLVIKIGWQGKNADGTLIRDGAKQVRPGVAFVVEPYVP